MTEYDNKKKHGSFECWFQDKDNQGLEKKFGTARSRLKSAMATILGLQCLSTTFHTKVIMRCDSSHNVKPSILLCHELKIRKITVPFSCMYIGILP